MRREIYANSRLPLEDQKFTIIGALRGINPENEDNGQPLKDLQTPIRKGRVLKSNNMHVKLDLPEELNHPVAKEILVLSPN